jgi:carbon storage regulator
MLVLSRRLNEAIRIGPDIQVICLHIRGNQVRIGVEAPPNVRIDREEIYSARKLREASAADPGPELAAR